jgi:hypothetical protein
MLPCHHSGRQSRWTSNMKTTVLKRRFRRRRVPLLACPAVRKLGIVSIDEDSPSKTNPA